MNNDPTFALISVAVAFVIGGLLLLAWRRRGR